MASVVSVVFETHSTTEDNEAGIATGWLPGRLSASGRAQAAELGGRRRADGVEAIFASDLERARETVGIAFAGSDIPVFYDARLRECNYGALNGAPTDVVVGDRRRYLDERYPDGESWREAIARVGRFLPDLISRWPGRRVVIVGHTATRYALDHHLTGIPVEELIDGSFEWRPGWEYRLTVG